MVSQLVNWVVSVLDEIERMIRVGTPLDLVMIVVERLNVNLLVVPSDLLVPVCQVGSSLLES